MKASASRVQRRPVLRAGNYLCLQVAVVAALACPSSARAQGPTSAGTAGPATSPPAADTSPAAIVAARELFREATEDADAGRHAAALEKFQRVARVRESAAVRFNIGKCEERLGRIGSALASYELAMQVARTTAEPRGEEIVRLARTAAEPLRTRAPRLTLSPGAAPPRELAVVLDGAALPVASLGIALPVDPGDHVIEADAPGRSHGRWTVTLTEGQSETIAIALGEGADPGPAVRTTSGGADDTGDGSRRAGADSAGARGTWWTTRHSGGVAVLGVGVAAAIVSVVFVGRHNSAVSDLRTACSGGCPESRRPELEATRDAAVRDETIALVAGSVAASAVLAGALLILWPTRAASTPHARGLVVQF